MSMEALSWAFEEEHLEPRDRFLLAMLANAADQNHRVTVSILAMSTATSLSKEKVRVVLNRLCQRGLIDLSDYTYPGFDGALLVTLKIGQEKEEEEEDLIV